METQKGEWRALGITVLMVGLSVALMALPTPAGLSVAGQRVLAVAVMAIGLWCTDAIPAAVTGILLVIALVLSGGVAGFPEALVGFAEPVAYFLVGVLTIGLAVLRSGLAERVARFFLRHSRGRSRALYLQMLLSFPLLTILLPSATTRTGILVFVYEQALDLGHVPRGAPLAKAIMLALSSINRLASTVLLTGGITPVLAASLIGGISWGRWLALMCVPYGILLVVGAVLIYLLHRKGFNAPLSPLPTTEPKPLSGKEIRTLAITLGASLLWLTDAWHHWNPALPAILAWACLLTPGIGVLSWKEFETGFGWANFFVIASSLSLARALASSGAGVWIAETIVRGMPEFSQQPILVVVVLLLAAALLRLLIPNIAGFLATTIPIAMSIGAATGLNPVICGLSVMIAGDAVLYYPAQSASSLVVYERGHLTAAEIFRFGLWMTLAAYLVVLFVALPYWQAIGDPLRLLPRG
ncbi:MAG: SLC13 family permease [Deltaproteobacteria bacterium]|nr:SLC13 family permease [Deltaproteobacteria bacterium]